MKRILLVIAGTCAFLGIAHADPVPTLESGETHAAAGIALPSVSTALYTNPAGLADQREHFRLGVVAISPALNKPATAGVQASPHWKILTVAAQVLRSPDGGDSSAYPFRLGVALEIPLTGLKLGATRYGQIHGPADGVNYSDFGATWTVQNFRLGGQLVNPTSLFHREFGIGAAAEIDSGVVVVLDLAHDEDRTTPGGPFTRRTAIKPGFKLGNALLRIHAELRNGKRARFRANLFGGRFVPAVAAHAARDRCALGWSVKKTRARTFVFSLTRALRVQGVAGVPSIGSVFGSRGRIRSGVS